MWFCCFVSIIIFIAKSCDDVCNKNDFSKIKLNFRCTLLTAAKSTGLLSILMYMYVTTKAYANFKPLLHWKVSLKTCHRKSTFARNFLVWTVYFQNQTVVWGHMQRAYRGGSCDFRFLKWLEGNFHCNRVLRLRSLKIAALYIEILQLVMA